MKKALRKVKSIARLIYLFPFIFYILYVISQYSKHQNIPIMNYLNDRNWMKQFLEQNLKKGYEISTGVWLLTYIAYLLFK
jgi:hypothetical protein